MQNHSAQFSRDAPEPGFGSGRVPGNFPVQILLQFNKDM